MALARLHWEMQPDVIGADGELVPLSVRKPFARQLRTTYSPAPTRPTRSTGELRALVIGDPGDPEKGEDLPGARTEALKVKELLEARDGVVVEARIGAPERLARRRPLRREARRPARGALAPPARRLRPRPLRGARRLRPRAAEPRRLGVRARAADTRRDRAPRAGAGGHRLERLPLGADVARARRRRGGRTRREPRRGSCRASPTSSSSSACATTSARPGRSTTSAPSSSHASSTPPSSPASRSARRCARRARRSGATARPTARSGPPTSTTATRTATLGLERRPVDGTDERRRVTDEELLAALQPVPPVRLARELPLRLGRHASRAVLRGRVEVELRERPQAQGRDRSSPPRGPRARSERLTLEFLGKKEYGSGEEVKAGDFLDAAGRRYVEDARRLHGDPRLADRAYGHAVHEASGHTGSSTGSSTTTTTRTSSGIGLHEGDWEMIQIRLGRDGNAEHGHLRAAPRRRGARVVRPRAPAVGRRPRAGRLRRPGLARVVRLRGRALADVPAAAGLLGRQGAARPPGARGDR